MESLIAGFLSTIHGSLCLSEILCRFSVKNKSTQGFNSFHKSTLSSLYFYTCPVFSLCFPDLTFCSTCSLWSTYQIPIHSTWVNALQCSMNTQIPWWQGSKQSWQLVDVTLIDSEQWSLTKESPHGTTPSQKLEDWRCLLIKKEFSPTLGPQCLFQVD